MPRKLMLADASGILQAQSRELTSDVWCSQTSVESPRNTTAVTTAIHPLLCILDDANIVLPRWSVRCQK